MAVSKTHPVELLLEAAAAGQRLFGENRVQEFAGKAQALAARSYAVDLGPSPERAHLTPKNPAHPEERSDEGPASALFQRQEKRIYVHLIGHLQSNKSTPAAELFSAIDTIDSLKLAERLHAAAQRLGSTLPILLEIKLSPEETKEGLRPDSPELATLLERLPDFATHLPLRGLMTVAPIADDPEIARACFQELRILRDKLAQHHPSLRFDELSMGMSGDFEHAIAEGSTTIRIGTAIFGIRPKQGGLHVQT